MMIVKLEFDENTPYGRIVDMAELVHESTRSDLSFGNFNGNGFEISIQRSR